MARPHPVVGLSAELPEGLRRCGDEAYVGVVAVCSGVVCVALVVGVNGDVARGVVLACFVGHDVGQGVDEQFLSLRAAVAQSQRFEPRRDVLLLSHEGDVEALAWQFRPDGIGNKSVLQPVVLHGGELSDGVESTVVVSEQQSVGRCHHASAESAETDDAVLQCRRIAIEARLWQLKSLRLHLAVHGIRQVVQRPHALVCRGGEGGGEYGTEGCYIFEHLRFMYFCPYRAVVDCLNEPRALPWAM